MAGRGSTGEKAARGEKTTASSDSLTWRVKLGVLVVQVQHLFLAPLVILTAPPPALLNQNIPLALVVGSVGLVGMMLGKRKLAIGASLTLLSLLIWGKAATNILKLEAPDTAVLLAEFTAVIAFAEASSTVLTFSGDNQELRDREDELSRTLGRRLETWLKGQLVNEARVSLVVLGLSLGLLPLAGVTSVSRNELVFSATLALLAVVVLMFLVTHRREPGPV